jgi:hypothetical protein
MKKRVREIFLCHSSSDRVLARKLKKVLEKRGFKVWFSESALIGAQRWHAEIGRALARCDWFILLATPSACRKPRNKPWWVQRETNYALDEDRYSDRLTPLLCKNVKIAQLKKISWVLPQIQGVELAGDFESACNSLVLQLKPKRRR